MENYWLIAKSITQAQRMESILRDKGYRCRYFRAPAAISKGGCSYAVAVDHADLAKITSVLDSAQLYPLQFFRRNENGWEEAEP